MQVHTARFGALNVDPSYIVTFPDGLIGLPELKTFFLVECGEESLFQWLQSVEMSTVSFIIIDPMLFCPGFVAEVSETDVSVLSLDKTEDAFVACLVTASKDFSKMTANLKAPLVFNVPKRLGKQLVLKNDGYHTNHFVLEELKKNMKSSLDATFES